MYQCRSGSEVSKDERIGTNSANAEYNKDYMDCLQDYVVFLYSM